MLHELSSKCLMARRAFKEVFHFSRRYILPVIPWAPATICSLFLYSLCRRSIIHVSHRVWFSLLGIYIASLFFSNSALSDVNLAPPSVYIFLLFPKISQSWYGLVIEHGGSALEIAVEYIVCFVAIFIFIAYLISVEIGNSSVLYRNFVSYKFIGSMLMRRSLPWRYRHEIKIIIY